MKETIHNVISTIIFSCKVVVINSFGWTILIIIVSLLSAWGVVFQARSLERLVNFVVSDGNSDGFIVQLFVWGTSIIVLNLFRLTNKYIDIHICEQIEKKYIPTIIDKYEAIEYSYFENKNYQNLFQNVTSSSCRDILNCFNTTLAITSSSISILGYIEVFLSSSCIIGMVSILTFFPLVFLHLLTSYIEMRQRWTMTYDIRKRYYFQSVFADKNALQEIKVFKSKDYFINKSEGLTEKINKELKTNLGKVGKTNILILILSTAFMVIVLIMSTLEMSSKTIMIGSYVVLIECVGMFDATEKRLAADLSKMVRYAEKAKFVLDFFALHEKKVKSDTTEKVDSNEIVVSFDNVTFRYPGETKTIINNISFTVKEGEVLSIVGENGCGKSTLIKLMTGLYKPCSGVIKLFGKSIDDLSEHQIRDIISVVFQDSSHYQLSLRENIALGRIGEIENDFLLKEKMKIAGIDNLFGLSKGLDQQLGHLLEGSTDLSGGEWARIKIARTLLAESPVLIFDEPMAALDPLKEKDMYLEIQKIVSNNNCSAIMISHRLASSRFADRIIVLDGGKIIEEGSHEELMEHKQMYYSMYTKQQFWYKE